MIMKNIANKILDNLLYLCIKIKCIDKDDPDYDEYSLEIVCKCNFLYYLFYPILLILVLLLTGIEIDNDGDENISYAIQ